ncbi:MAG: tRNA threonylcarbamoyladenosine dehydratase [bacterium]|nr:tRNA threonylcarbamoyladenosine dehydratase [bacterium]
MLERLELLIGKEKIEELRNKKILVIGLGGVGGYVVESLVRSGIESIIIVDNDVVDITNLNRQIIATRDNIGKRKTLEFERRIKSINPDCKVKTISEFITKDNIDKLFEEKIDYLIDACDTVSTKKLIIDNCIKENISFVTCLGTGKRLRPELLTITDIRNTKYDPIARILRKYVKDSNYKGKIMCLFSEEEPIECKEGIGSNSFVPPSAGLLIASYVIRDLIDLKK